MNTYIVEARLDDCLEPYAPHAYGPVVLTFTVRGTCLVNAVKEAQTAVREISKLRSTLEKVELKYT